MQLALPVMKVFKPAASDTVPLLPQVLGAFSHEPVVLTLPKGQGFVLYKIGCADNATTGSNGTFHNRPGDKKLIGRCVGCKNGVTNQSVFCPHPDQVYECASGRIQALLFCLATGSDSERLVPTLGWCCN